MNVQPCLKKRKPVGRKVVAGRLYENGGRQYGRGEHSRENLSTDYPIKLGFQTVVVK